MKNSIIEQSNPKDNMLLAAVKKAIANTQAASISAGQKGINASTKQTYPATKTTANQLKLNQVNKRLNEADSTITSKVNQENKGGGTTERTPTMSEIQQNEEYYQFEARKKEAKSREAFERNLRHDLYDEPLAKKPVPLDKGVYDLGDSTRAPLHAGGAFVKNGAHTRGYADTASDTGAPIRFTAGTNKDRERKFDEAMVRQAVTMNDFHAYLDGGHIDLESLTAEQKDIIDLVEKELTKKSVLGTLTKEDKSKVFENTLEFLYSHTKSANGDPYPVFIDIISNDYTRKMIPELGSIQTDGLSESDTDAIFDYGRQYSDDEETSKIFEGQREYKKEVFLEEVEKYNRDLRSGAVKVGDFQEYYDRAMVKIYENCLEPIYFRKDKHGNGIGESIKIGELIPPEDDSFGAEVARTALQLIGLPYGEQAGQGIRPNLKIDCQGLVRWVLSEIDTDLGDYGIGKGARYQIDDADPIWSIDEGREITSDDLQIGNTLFWQGDETGEITHTAIYIGKVNDVDLMIEAGGDSVRIVPLREHTNNPDGEDSTLCQINQMLPERLQENVTEYLQTNNG